MADNGGPSRKASAVAAQGPMNQAPRVYNAIYSAVQVYECMVRGIAVMRRRVDSYVNATQILKVAGIDKGRRTKILEKEILPGKHEIVQGGYGKYQGTWIPLERGREIANQFGVSALLAPLFDYIPPTPSVAPRMPGGVSPSVPRPFYSPQALASPHFGSPGVPYHSMTPSHIPPQSLPRGSPFLPQAFPPMMNPNTTPKAGGIPRAQTLGAPSPIHTAYLYPGSPNPYSSPRPLMPSSVLKRPREEPATPVTKKEPNEPPMTNGTSTLPRTSSQDSSSNKPPPAKRPRLEPSTSDPSSSKTPQPSTSQTDAPPPNKPNVPPLPTPAASKAQSRNPRHRSVVSAISHDDDVSTIMDLLQTARTGSQSVDVILDEQGHTALHYATSLSRLALVDALIQAGADTRRGNLSGETPLMRCVLSPSSAQGETFPAMLERLSDSIDAVDATGRSALHHIALVAGVSQRASAAQYYMITMLEFLVRSRESESEAALLAFVNERDVYGDTALNLAARVGNRVLVQDLLDVGADASIGNNLGLRPVEFGVFEDDTGPPIEPAPLPEPPINHAKEDELISELTQKIQKLSIEFTSAMSTRQTHYNSLQSQIIHSASELKAQRRLIRESKDVARETEVVEQRIKNLERALRSSSGGLFGSANAKDEAGGKGGLLPVLGDESSVADSTQASTVSAASSAAGTSSSTTMVESQQSTPIDLSRVGAVEVISPISSAMALIRMRKIRAWQKRLDLLLAERISDLAERSAESETQCRKVVSACTGVPVDKVDEALGTLTASLESENAPLESSRLSAYMQRTNGHATIV